MENSISFVRAERRNTHVKIALTGTSGSGKTLGAIRLALGIGLPVAVIDTEGGASELYADEGSFDVLTLEPPYCVGAYLEAMEAAISGGYGTLVIDSLTPAWRQTLNQKAHLDSRPNANSFANWRVAGQDYARLMESIVRLPMHVIATIRSRTAYAQTVQNGRVLVKRLGIEPEARPGTEYEFTTVLDIERDSHQASCTKDRTRLFEGRATMLTPEEGQRLRAWSQGAKAL